MPTVRALIADSQSNRYLLLEGNMVSLSRDREEPDEIDWYPRWWTRELRETVTLEFVRTREVYVTEEWVRQNMRPPEEIPPARPALAEDSGQRALPEGGGADAPAEP